MRQMFQYTFTMFFILLLAACGGGNSLDGGTSGGGGSDGVPQLSLVLEDPTQTVTNKVSTSTPGTLIATLQLDGSPQSGKLINFSLLGDVGQLLVTSKLTDEQGQAKVELSAGNNENAGTVQAQYDDIVAQLDFEVSISAANVTMEPITMSPSVVEANGTSTLSVLLNETLNGVVTPVSEGIDVTFTSVCAENGTAVITVSGPSENGIATASYKDNGCGEVDTIIASANIGSQILRQQSSLTVEAADPATITFISATPTMIALRGKANPTLPETSRVSFVVKDSIENPVANVLVNFSLNTTVGGITMSPEAQAKTDVDGKVDVIVRSGNIPTAVVIHAALASAPSIFTSSSSLAISTGVADSGSLSVSATTLNVEGLNHDNTKTTIVALMADHSNNPVADGTAINFTTEFGAVGAICLTKDGGCSVEWNSQAPKSPDPAFRNPTTTVTRKLGVDDCFDGSGVATNISGLNLPCPGTLGNVYGNRVSILVHALGEESFVDANANGRYDNGERFTDLGEAFRDDNGDGLFTGLLEDGSSVIGSHDEMSPGYEPGGDNEEFVDLVVNGEYDSANGEYNGISCNDENDGCSSELVTISRTIEILQSGSHAFIGLYEQGNSPYEAESYFPNHPIDTFTRPTVDLVTLADDPDVPGDDLLLVISTPKTINITVADIHNGRMPAGTTVEVDVGNGEIVGPNSFVVGNSSAHGISSFSVVVKADDERDVGPLVVSVTTPLGVLSTASLTLVD